MSYYDTCKRAKSSDLVALKANVQKVDFTHTQLTEKTAVGSFSFERVQPRNSNYTIKNIYLKVSIEFTVTRDATKKSDMFSIVCVQQEDCRKLYSVS